MLKLFEKYYVRDIPIEFRVEIINKGTASAEDITVALYHSPQYNQWYEFNGAEVVEGSPPKIFQSNKGKISVIFPSQIIVVEYRTSFSAMHYDEVVQKGDEPKITFEINYRGAETPIIKYCIVKLP